MRLTDPRFLSDWKHRDFRYFLKIQVGNLASDRNIEKMVELCFSKKELHGLNSTFWRLKDIDAANDPALKGEIARRVKQSDRSLGAIARIFIEEITRFSGCERACVKFPVDVGHVPELLQWFPDCKIIHITRDPRAVAMSKTNDPSGTAIKIMQHPRLAWLIRKLSVWFVIAQYWRTARVHRRFRQLSNYKLFRYEDLLAEPEKTLKDLCKFIEVEFSQELLHPETGVHLHQASSLTGKQKKADQKKHENAGIRSSYASHFPYCSPTSIRCLCANSVIVWKATNGSLERWLSGLRQRLVRVAMRLKSHRRFESFPSPPLPTDF